MPLLHRGHFEQNLRDGLHKENRDFGELVLSVCGLAARYTDDTRVLSAGTDSKHSLGEITAFTLLPNTHARSMLPFRLGIHCTDSSYARHEPQQCTV